MEAQGGFLSDTPWENLGKLLEVKLTEVSLLTGTPGGFDALICPHPASSGSPVPAEASPPQGTVSPQG